MYKGPLNNSEYDCIQGLIRKFKTLKMMDIHIKNRVTCIKTDGVLIQKDSIAENKISAMRSCCINTPEGLCHSGGCLMSSLVTVVCRAQFGNCCMSSARHTTVTKVDIKQPPP